MTSIDSAPAGADAELLRFLTCGSVDDGKSTLIGRLLYDTKAILADTLEGIERASKRRGLAAPDLSLLTDGLQAEREQGITIDVAYRYFSTGTRQYIIADAPGHEQYTRNMVTAASTADLALILVDARKGVLPQTRRHAFLAHLMNIPNLIVLVNKMDLADYSQNVFHAIERDMLEFAAQIPIKSIRCLPSSAKNGDMVAERGARLGWYTGPTLLEILESAKTPESKQAAPFRFPVQYVCRGQRGYRGFMGRIESGHIAVGDEVVVLPGGKTTHIRDIQILGDSLRAARAGQSIALLPDDEIDISRGDMIVKTGQMPNVVKRIDATLCWLSETPLDPRRKYLVRHTTRDARAIVSKIDGRVDIDTMTRVPADALEINDIAQVGFKLAQPIFADAYTDNRATGAFIVIDESNNHTVGAGMIR